MNATETIPDAPSEPWGQARVGDWIQTRSGVKFHLLDPRPKDFVISDIAHALANTCRFAGHVSKFYSVAEHSVRVARFVAERTDYRPKWPEFGATIRPSPRILRPGDYVYAALMHDASESYLGDVPRPIKHLPEFAIYRETEDYLMLCLAVVFRFENPLPAIVKVADNTLMATEARDLMWPVTKNWHLKYDLLPGRIRPWSPRKAKREFLSLFYKINPLGITKPRSRVWAFFTRAA
ncbi:phosphohydrolase [Singulisphaera sp. Ch08]|uniref:Phosphohydrolase n=1 Tax=Singulisphaera sp. Ch08 TaxID=3120278 RepID=A0AAU7CKI4_9BACT